MKKSEKELLNKSIIRSSLVLVSLFSFMVGFLIIVESITTSTDNMEILLSYDTFGKVEQVINLKDNDLYDEKITSNDHVISKYIDKINLTFNYELYGSKEVKSQNKYKIKAYLINSYTKNNKQEEFLKKEFYLLDESIKTSKETSKVIQEETIIIDYDYFNNLAKKIREESGVLTEAKLKVDFILDNEVEVISNDISFNDSHIITVEIPLLENITTITKTGEFENNENLYEENTNNINSFQLIIGIILVIISVGFIYTAIKMFLDINNISKYLIEKNKILKRFGDIIAETTTKPDLNQLEVMEITNIIDLVNIEDELRSPIIYYEVIKGKESWFIINHNNKVYRYILRKKNG